MKREEAESLLCYEAVEGAFMEARLGRDAGPERMERLLIALKVLWLHYQPHAVLPKSVTSPAALILYFWQEAAQAIRESGSDYRESLVDIELPELGRSAFELLSGSDASPVIRKHVVLDP